MFGNILTLPALCISESRNKRKIDVNFYFDTFLWCRKRFYEMFLKEKSSFKMLVLTFFSKLDWSSYIISIAKTASKKIGALIRSMKCLSPEVALYLYKSTRRPHIEYCCPVWAGAPSCYLELLHELQKRICRTVVPSPITSLEPLAHRRNVASLSLFYRYYFGRCSSELAQLVPLPHSRGRSAR